MTNTAYSSRRLTLPRCQNIDVIMTSVSVYDITQAELLFLGLWRNLIIFCQWKTSGSLLCLQASLIFLTNVPKFWRFSGQFYIKMYGKLLSLFWKIGKMSWTFQGLAKTLFKAFPVINDVLEDIWTFMVSKKAINYIKSIVSGKATTRNHWSINTHTDGVSLFKVFCKTLKNTY